MCIIRRTHLLDSRRSSFSLLLRQARTAPLTYDFNDWNAVAVIAGGSADDCFSLLVLEVDVEVDPLLLMGTGF